MGGSAGITHPGRRSNQWGLRRVAGPRRVRVGARALPRPSHDSDDSLSRGGRTRRQRPNKPAADASPPPLRPTPRRTQGRSAEGGGGGASRRDARGGRHGARRPCRFGPGGRAIVRRGRGSRRGRRAAYLRRGPHGVRRGVRGPDERRRELQIMRPRLRRPRLLREAPVSPRRRRGPFDAPTSFAIDGTSIYFAVDAVLESCGLSGTAITTGVTQLRGGDIQPRSHRRGRRIRHLRGVRPADDGDAAHRQRPRRLPCLRLRGGDEPALERPRGGVRQRRDAGRRVVDSLRDQRPGHVRPPSCVLGRWRLPGLTTSGDPA